RRLAAVGEHSSAVGFDIAFHREHELETGAAGLGVFVDEIALVSAGIGTRDRQPQPRAGGALAGAGLPRKALEAVRDARGRYAVAAVLDDDSKMAIGLHGLDGDRRLAV